MALCKFATRKTPSTLIPHGIRAKCSKNTFTNFQSVCCANSLTQKNIPYSIHSIHSTFLPLKPNWDLSQTFKQFLMNKANSVKVSISGIKKDPTKYIVESRIYAVFSCFGSYSRAQQPSD